MKRFYISLFLIFQAYYMLFAPISCDCKQSFNDLLWFIVVMSGIGVFCITERDINRTWNKLFQITGCISFLFCAIYILTFNSNLISNYFFNLIIYSVYLISVIYLVIHTLISKNYDGN